MCSEPEAGRLGHNLPGAALGRRGLEISHPGELAVPEGPAAAGNGDGIALLSNSGGILLGPGEGTLCEGLAAHGGRLLGRGSQDDGDGEGSEGKVHVCWFVEALAASQSWLFIVWSSTAQSGSALLWVPEASRLGRCL